MSRFGWSLPPGCGTLPGEEDEQPLDMTPSLDNWRAVWPDAFPADLVHLWWHLADERLELWWGPMDPMGEGPAATLTVYLDVRNEEWTGDLPVPPAENERARQCTLVGLRLLRGKVDLQKHYRPRSILDLKAAGQ